MTRGGGEMECCHPLPVPPLPPRKEACMWQWQLPPTTLCCYCFASSHGPHTPCSASSPAPYRLLCVQPHSLPTLCSAPRHPHPRCMFGPALPLHVGRWVVALHLCLPYPSFLMDILDIAQAGAKPCWEPRSPRAL